MRRATALDFVKLLVLMELIGDPPEDPPLEQLRDAEYHDMQDKKDGTGRWNKKGTPHDKRWWHTKAHRLDSRTFTAMFRLRCTLLFFFFFLSSHL